MLPIAAIAQQNPFSVYCDNLNEIMDKYGAKFNLCVYGIVNTWSIGINEMGGRVYSCG